MNQLDDYAKIATQSNYLKTQENLLNKLLENHMDMRELVVEREKKFYMEHATTETLTRHLIHYRCVIECLLMDIKSLATQLSSDEFCAVSLGFHEAENAIMRLIDDTTSDRTQLCHKHENARNTIELLLSKHLSLLVDKLHQNLVKQQKILTQRDQTMKIYYFEIFNNQDISLGPF